MAILYDDTFFDWVDMTARRSAEAVVPLLRDCAAPKSVVDVGCGRGTWLAVWASAGINDIRGLDGAYVDQKRLAITAEQFETADLTKTWAIQRRFDLAQSLEVAEHLPASCGPIFVNQLCQLADIVAFSAARPGQGGENHINERPVSYWAKLFQEQGYQAFDCLRPLMRDNAAIDPWYRYNTVVYANAAGQQRLSDAARAAQPTDLETLNDAGDLAWRLRAMVLRPLPVAAVTALSRLRYTIASTAARRTKQAS
jgi:SAM-dependent methyltransferase